MEFKVLDKGLVKLIDFMGTDTDIVDAARVSYEPSMHKSSDEGLIRYLYRHKHTTPFEMCEVKLYLKMPVFVARQWIRHRTANINEYSGRYSVIKDEFYIPPTIRSQSKSNKQGSGDVIDPETFLLKLLEEWNDTPELAFEQYNHLLEYDVAREQARIHLPLSMYTEFYWKVDLHNLLHFLKLRTDPHAQEEIRVFANAIEEIVQHLYPMAHKAWTDYSKLAYNLSRMELQILQDQLNWNPDTIKAFERRVNNSQEMSEREKKDFLARMVR